MKLDSASSVCAEGIYKVVATTPLRKLLTIHFSTRVSALVREFDSTSDNTFELIPLAHWATMVLAFNTKFYLMSSRFTNKIDDANTWKILNDFAFLKFKVND